MAQGFLQSFDNKIEVYSAGTFPATKISPRAIKVMHESGIDISKNSPKSVNEFLNYQWDYLITVCDDANETCPVFIGNVNNRLHIGFEDPSRFSGSEEVIMGEFRRVRNLIKSEFYKLYIDKIKPQLNE
jgi:arsenate reductase (thioredoxin)